MTPVYLTNSLYIPEILYVSSLEMRFHFTVFKNVDRVVKKKRKEKSYLYRFLGIHHNMLISSTIETEKET